MSHLVQKGWKRLVGEAMSLQGCNTVSRPNPPFVLLMKKVAHIAPIPSHPPRQGAKKPILVSSSEKRSSLVQVGRYHTAMDQGTVY